MAGRIRTIKPEVFEDHETGTLTDAGFRLYAGMVAQADDWGNLRAVVAQLCGYVFWSQKKPPDVAELLRELERKGVIRRYEVDGLPYAAIVGWNDRGHPRYQAVDHKGKTRRVPPPATEAQPFLPIAGSRETLASGSRDKREESRGARYPQTSDSSRDPIRTDPNRSEPIRSEPDAQARAIPVLVPDVDADGRVTPESIRAQAAHAVATLRGRTAL